jgi:hypothetical protein
MKKRRKERKRKKSWTVFYALGRKQLSEREEQNNSLNVKTLSIECCINMYARPPPLKQRQSNEFRIQALRAQKRQDRARRRENVCSLALAPSAPRPNPPRGGLGPATSAQEIKLRDRGGGGDMCACIMGLRSRATRLR